MRTMKPDLKAIVLKTPRLKETLSFYIDRLGFTIKESSPTHFVIHSKGIRILFVESNNSIEIELYLAQKSTKELSVEEDPNYIKVVVLPTGRELESVKQKACSQGQAP